MYRKLALGIATLSLAVGSAACDLPAPVERVPAKLVFADTCYGMPVAWGFQTDPQGWWTATAVAANPAAVGADSATFDFPANVSWPKVPNLDVRSNSPARSLDGPRFTQALNTIPVGVYTRAGQNGLIPTPAMPSEVSQSTNRWFGAGVTINGGPNNGKRCSWGNGTYWDGSRAG